MHLKLRKRQLVPLVVALLALGLGIGATVYHQQTKRAVADYQKQLIASGEKLTVEELTPTPVPPDQNGASIFFRAMALMNVPQEIFRTNPPSAMTMVAPGRARVGWTQPDIRSREATNTWQDAIATVDDLSPAIALLEELIGRPTIDFNVNYRFGLSLPLPNLIQTKQAAQNLYYATLCDLHRGDAGSATRRLRALLAMSQSSADERLVISQLVRMAITAYAVVTTWEFLQSPSVTDEQLAQIQSDWNRLEFTLAAENALTMERAMSQMTVEQMRDSSMEFRKMASGFSWPGAGSGATFTGGSWLLEVEKFGQDTWNSTRLKAKETAWRYSWSYTDQLRSLKGQQVLIETARLARTNENFGAALAMQEQRWEALGLPDIAANDFFGSMPADMDFRTMLSQGIRSLTKFLDKVMKIETSRQLTVTAIALQRYKLRHGNYPTDLAALTPEFLPSRPRDPVDGKPLRYKANTGGTFLLYSVGEDREDNGGDPSPALPGSQGFSWQRGRDWVWPQPATSKEIEDFYQHPPN